MQNKLHVKPLPIQHARSAISSIPGTNISTTAQQLSAKARFCSEALTTRRQAEHSELASQEEFGFSEHNLTTSINNLIECLLCLYH